MTIYEQTTIIVIWCHIGLLKLSRKILGKSLILRKLRNECAFWKHRRKKISRNILEKKSEKFLEQVPPLPFNFPYLVVLISVLFKTVDVLCVGLNWQAFQRQCHTVQCLIQVIYPGGGTPAGS